MLNIDIAGTSVRCVIKSATPHKLRQRVEDTMGFSRDEYYIVHNGRLLQDDSICLNGHATVVPRLLGGKGGFGSMLRAIGAQIEKTTNREACRDLSGRRLRDINEEKRLKAWIEKQANREKEAVERKKKKLEKLCTEPRHEFKDQRYEQERAELTERVGDAVEEGFKAACSSGIKRKHEEEMKSNKRKTILDLDIDSDEFESSDLSDDSDAEDIEHNSLFIKADEGETNKQERDDGGCGHASNDEKEGEMNKQESECGHASNDEKEGETNKQESECGHTSNDENVEKTENKPELPTDNQTNNEIFSNESASSKTDSIKNLEDQSVDQSAKN